MTTGTIAKCKCQHCEQNIEFETSHAGESVACPNCGMDTLLFSASLMQPVRPKSASKSQAAAQTQIAKPEADRAIRSVADNFKYAAIFCCILAGIAFGVTVMASMANNFNGSDNLMTGGSITGALLSIAGWLYIISQLVHIRANTHPEKSDEN